MIRELSSVYSSSMDSSCSLSEICRLRVTIFGAVQGVGFRPFIYRLATELGLKGWVRNSSQGILVEVEGEKKNLDQFLARIWLERPKGSFIQSFESSFLDPKGYAGFEILESDALGDKAAVVMPDVSACAECLSEIRDPRNRRYRYPFTNCTHCGPRYSVIENLPYDRPNTTMKTFVMCAACEKEYREPLNRRFHAQPNACSACGPHLELWDSRGQLLSSHEEALQKTIQAIKDGQIAAVKGLGGFHLMADATKDEAVRRLRERKHREEKPFALMYPSLESVKAECEVSGLEERLLLSPESPIVLLLRRKPDPDRSRPVSRSSISDWVAPSNPYLGVMLPYTPLHYLLMEGLNLPVVATSGNLSEEPIATDEREAVKRLRGLADLFLVHNRPIARHVDDSIVRVIGGREAVLRRARGYAPLPIPFGRVKSRTMAVGAHLKSAVAISRKSGITSSQHIGDLDSVETLEAFKRVGKDLARLYDEKPERIVCDLHPGYRSTRVAEETSLPVVRVQHHLAHIASCMAENEVEAPCLGVSWDGTGWGADETVWGGEFFHVLSEKVHRVGSFRRFRLPGSEQAIREPRRTAVGLLYELFGASVFGLSRLKPVEAFSANELRNLETILSKRIQSPWSSSAGRLFDAVSALLDLCQVSRFEGQAAMLLEYSLEGCLTQESYPVAFLPDEVTPPDTYPRPSHVFDWGPMMFKIIEDLEDGVPRGMISAKFHNTLAEVVVAVAALVREPKVVLSGGCFQNKFLTERAIQRLSEGGFRPYWHQRIPTNDGGIAVGQLAVASESWDLEMGKKQACA